MNGRGPIVRRLAAMLAALLLCGASPPPEPFTIPAILSLTGSGAALGTAEGEALKLLAELVNRSGGIHGRPIDFALADDQSSPQVALQLANAALATHPPVMIATTLVAGCNAILPLLADGPVTYCLSAGMSAPKDSYMFAYGVPTKVRVRLQVKFFRDRGWKRIAAIDTTDATGQDFDRNLDAALAAPENRDVVLVSHQRFAASDVSVAAQLAAIKAAQPQAIIAWATGTPVGTVFHGMADLGINVPTGTSGGNINYGLMKQYAAILPKELYFVNVPGAAPDVLPPGPLKAAASAYFNTLRAAGIPPDGTHVVGWDPGTILVSALRAVGLDAPPARYKAYIENLHDFYAGSGAYDFRDGSQRGLDGRSDIVLRYDGVKGQFVAVARIGSIYAQK